MASEHPDANESKSSADGAVEEAKGRVKKAVGALTGDRDLERDGELDRAAGDAKRTLGSAVDKVTDGVRKLLGDDDEKRD